MRVYERGAGITEACGTGACAAAVAASRWGLAVPDERRRNHRAHGRRGCEGALRRRRRARAHRTGHLHRDHRDATRMSLIERAFREKIVLVGVTLPPATDDDTEASLDELALLVDTAGADEVARVVQRRDAPDPATFVGKGKAEELRELCLAVDADTVVFDNELTPGPAVQPREAARPHGHRPHRGDPRHLRPERPQPRGQGPGRAGPAPLPAAAPAARRERGLTRQAGGIGARRGPGETQLEVDRRRIVRRIPSSRPSCATSSAPRQRSARAAGAAAWPTWASSGYTNAGKSHAAQPAHRRRRAGRGPPLRHPRPHHPPPRTCPAARRCSLTDTVGFVRKLPHQLVEAFKSTLEVVAEADLLVHVVDARRRRSGGPDRRRPHRAGRDRRRRGARAAGLQQGRPGPERGRAARPAATRAAVAVSAATGEGIDDLLRTLADRLRALATVVELRRPLRPGRRAGRRPPRGRGAVDGPARTAACASGPASTTPRRPARRVRRRRPLTDRPVTWARWRQTLADMPASSRRRTRTTASTARRRSPRPIAGGVVDLSDRHAVRPAARRGGRGPGPLRRRAGLPAVHRHARAARGGRGWMRPALRRRRARRPTWRRASAPRSSSAALPQWLRLRTPDRDTVLYPAVATRPTRWARSWPAAGPCRCPSTTTGGSTSPPSTPPTPARALCLWVNTPGQPDRRARRPRRGRGLGAGPRRAGVQRRVLRRVHLGRPPRARSSSTGSTAWWPCTRCRSGRTWPASGSASTPATPSWSSYLPEVRKHVGMMVPGPVQAAAVAALGDDAPRRRAARPLPAPARAAGARCCAPGRASTWSCPAVASTSGSTSAMPGRSPRSWPRRGARS